MEYSEGSLLLPSISPPAPSAAPASGEHKHQLRVGLLALCSTFTHTQSSSAKSGKCILLLTEKEQSTTAAVVPLCWHCLSQCLSLRVMLDKTKSSRQLGSEMEPSAACKAIQKSHPIHALSLHCSYCCIRNLHVKAAAMSSLSIRTECRYSALILIMPFTL